jgi:glucan phosphoethanolaminetransferase (alkaline phosphatase superfamily)
MKAMGARNLLRQALASRVAATFIVLCLPYLALGAWLGHAKGMQSVAAYVASVGLLLWLFAFVARTWRRFFLLQFPLLLLGVAFAAYTLSFDNLPGQVIAYVLATSSWEEVRGFFSIWQGQRLLLAALLLASIYLILAWRSPPRPIPRSRNVYLRWGPMVAVVLLSGYAAPNSAALIDGIATNPIFGTAMFLDGPLRHAEAAVNGTAMQKLSYGASHIHSEEVHILVIGESARRDSWSAVSGEAEGRGDFLSECRGRRKSDHLCRAHIADGNVARSFRLECDQGQSGRLGCAGRLLHRLADEPGSPRIAADRYPRRPHALSAGHCDSGRGPVAVG